jgi:hypothetical protein
MSPTEQHYSAPYPPSWKRDMPCKWKFSLHSLAAAMRAPKGKPELQFDPRPLLAVVERSKCSTWNIVSKNVPHGTCREFHTIDKP